MILKTVNNPLRLPYFFYWDKTKFFFYYYIYLYDFLPRNFLTATHLVKPSMYACAKSTSPKAPLPISLIKTILARGIS